MDEKEKEEKIVNNNKGLLLDCYTYDSEYLGLFSYKNKRSKDISNKTLFLQEEKYIFRIENEIDERPQHYSEKYKDKEEEYICKVIVDDFNFILRRPFTKDLERLKNKFFYVINTFGKYDEEQFNIKNEEFYLDEGDIFKLSFHLFLIRTIYIKDKIEPNEKEEKNIYDIHNLDPENHVPKINTCYDPNILNEKNYCIHIVKDLEEGENSKTANEIKENLEDKILYPDVTYHNDIKTTKYSFKLKICEECNKFYPLRFKLNENSEIIDLINLNIPKDKNYILIESIEDVNEKDKEKDNYCKKVFFLTELTGEDQTITIGRNKKDVVDLIISPKKKTISKKHAAIKYIKNKGKFLFQDLCCHCGTTVLIQSEEIQIKEEKEIYLQSGRTFIIAKICDKEEYERIKDENEIINKVREQVKQKEEEQKEENEKKNKKENNILEADIKEKFN